MPWSVTRLRVPRPTRRTPGSSDEGRSSLIALGEKVEQQFAARPIERDERQFIDDQQGSLEERLVKTPQGGLGADLHSQDFIAS